MLTTTTRYYNKRQYKTVQCSVAIFFIKNIFYRNEALLRIRFYLKTKLLTSAAQTWYLFRGNSDELNAEGVVIDILQRFLEFSRHA